MKRTSKHWPLLLPMALLAAAPALPGGGETPPPTKAEALTEMGQTVKTATEAMKAGRFDEAGKLLDSLIHADTFRTVDPRIQFATFMLAGIAAEGRRDYLGAHEFMLAATQYEEAKADQWLQRARYAARVDDDVDAAQALIAVAQNWPSELLKNENNDFTFRVAYSLGLDPRRRSESVALADALFDAEFTLDAGEQPSALWQGLARDAVTRKDLVRAREVATRVAATAVLLRMRVDKRYDALIQAEPGRFDLAAAAKRRVSDLRRTAADQPRSLHTIVRLADALGDQGNYAEALELCNAALRKVAKAGDKQPAYDDMGEAL